MTQSIYRHNLSVTYACYGVAMFSGKERFDQYHQEIEEDCSYDGMRSEIAEKHFDGNDDFSLSDLTTASSGFQSGSDSGGFDSGGDDGGSD